jgi:hypothetical protein
MSKETRDAEDIMGGESDAGPTRSHSCPFSKVIPLYFGFEGAAFDIPDGSTLLVVDRLEREEATPWQIFGEDSTDAATGIPVPRTSPRTPLTPAAAGERKLHYQVWPMN